MATVLWIGLLIYAVVVAGWLFRHVLLTLPRAFDLVVAPDDSLPKTNISVVVPARNERARISSCLQTLRSQGPVVGEIIVVDDRSDDDTGQFVREVAAIDPRIRVLRVDGLPAGWVGKAHACHLGGQAASSEWILFTDADCRFLAGGLAGAVEHAERHMIDFLSLWPRADHGSFWEHMLIPLCGALILYWFPPFRVNSPRSCSAYATGQFILIRRSAYQRIGGHSSARLTVIEDIPLARHAKRSGLRLRTALGADVVRVRMYSNYREVHDGWTRIFIGAIQRPWKLLWSVWSLVGGSILPCLGAPLTAILVLLRGWPDEPLWRASLVLVWFHYAAVYSVSFRAWGLCRCDRRYLALYPVSCFVVIGVLLRAWWTMVRRRPIVWRGSVTGSAVLPASLEVDHPL